MDDDEEETLEDLNRLLADTKAANARVDDEDGKPLVPSAFVESSLFGLLHCTVPVE